MLFHIFEWTKWVVSFSGSSDIIIKWGLIETWSIVESTKLLRYVTLNFANLFVVAVAGFLILLITSDVVAGPQVYYRNHKEMGCPEFNQHETVHLPHPFSCNKYLTCLSKSVLEQSCPGELHWNIEKNMCDYKDDAKCMDDNTVYYNRISKRSRFK